MYWFKQHIIIRMFYVYFKYKMPYYEIKAALKYENSWKRKHFLKYC